MSANQIRLVVFAIGLFLLSVLVYRWQLFTHFVWSIFLFKALLPISLVLISCGLGRLLRLPLVVCIALPVLAELTSWQYIRHVVRDNVNVPAPNVGVLDQWIVYRDVIQYNSQFSSYSPDLSYTLRPGSEGEHADLEYRNKFRINSFGVRDDEASLHHPRIIFLGDSFTMGWGIDQEKTFAQLTEKETGVRSLNAGISSYGTYREMLLLKKLPRDSCRVLVIQYCDNDLEENAARNRPDSQGQTLTKEQFEKVTVFNRLNESYFPMRFTYFFIREKDLFKRIFTSPRQVWSDCDLAISSWIAGEPLPGRKPPVLKSPEQAQMHSVEFFKVIDRIRAFYPGHIVVMHIDGRYTKPQLINAFAQNNKVRLDAKLHFLRVSDFLEVNDFYPIDGHLNEKGHRKIAEHLSALIREKDLLSTSYNMNE